MSRELGTLVVVVLKAQNLPDKHTFSKQDPYAKITLNGVTQQTPVDKRGGQHPLWDGEFRFQIMKDSGDKFRKLGVSVWAKEPREDDLLGQGKVDITETLQTGEFDEWVKLENNNVYRGELYLEMTFYSSEAPPPTISTPPSSSSPSLLAPQSSNLMRRPSKLAPSDRTKRPTHAYAYPSDPLANSSNAVIDNRKKLKAQGSVQASATPGPFRAGPERNHLALQPSPSPPSSRSSSSSPSRHGRSSPLPPLPEDVPNVLKAGASRPSQASLPSTLRPGAGLSSGSPPRSSYPVPSSPGPENYDRRGSGRPVSPPVQVAPYQPVTGMQYASSYTPVTGSAPFSPPTPSPRPASTPYVPVTSSTPAPYLPAANTAYPPVSSTLYPPAAPEPWQPASSPISFPVPHTPAPISPGHGHPQQQSQQQSQQQQQQPPISHTPAAVSPVHGYPQQQQPQPPISHTPASIPPAYGYQQQPQSPISHTPAPVPLAYLYRQQQQPQPPISHTPAPAPPAYSYPPQQLQPQQQQQGEDLPDPYLSAKYRAPAPLPQAAEPHTPSPAPLSPRPAHRANSDPPQDKRANRPASSKHQPASGPDPARRAEQRHAEELAKKKAQEEEDLEFARRLDRELNID